jgi:hypothetical protein
MVQKLNLRIDLLRPCLAKRDFFISITTKTELESVLKRYTNQKTL